MLTRLAYALLLVSGVIALLVTPACGVPASGSVTVYRAHCEGKVDRISNRCSGQITNPLNRSTFTVDASQQRVIEQYDYEGALPARLEGCTVKDVENWSCCVPAPGATPRCQAMSQRTYNTFGGEDLPSDDVVYVSQTEWLRLKSR